MMAVTADGVSGGRLVLGLGAGWYDPEYLAFGFPTDHRVDRFEEALRIIGPLLRGERLSFTGRYHQMRDAPRRRWTGSPALSSSAAVESRRRAVLPDLG
jgi:alkanesulfonate monooxygenase SsuD/methylene tetrahydromethanopterin reductase-like flavin-dependent oxidoreductase (luciferase family)